MEIFSVLDFAPKYSKLDFITFQLQILFQRNIDTAFPSRSLTKHSKICRFTLQILFLRLHQLLIQNLFLPLPFQEFDTDPDSDLVVNHVHPGWVDTDMTSHKGPLTIEEGARDVHSRGVLELVKLQKCTAMQW